ncbi:MAG: hypothetical protein J7559_00540 [Cohnella sp.]|nr:hypothetical protein [Cohnella sp.]
MSEYTRRIKSLQAVEVLCYSLCVHLLVEEALAINAAKTALMDLFKDDQFWELEGEERDKRVRKHAIARSMELLVRQSKVVS